MSPMFALVAAASAAVAPNVTYHGRWHVTSSGAVCAWPMSSFSLSLNGTSVSASLTPGADGARLKVLVDGAEAGYVTLPNGASKSTYKLASGLEPGLHEVSVIKVTEDLTQAGTSGALHLHGVDPNAGGTIQPARPSVDTRVRRLEFIGDSDTAGWCADGKPSGGDKALKHENSYETWAAQLARGLGVTETSTVAVSGWGVTPASGRIQDVYRNTYGYSGGPKWDFASWTPDAVVILIGPNDEFIAGQGADNVSVVLPTTVEARRVAGAKFVAAYVELLNEVATAYDGVAVPPPIVSVCGGSINGLEPCDDIRTAIMRFNSDAPKGWRAEYTTIGKPDWKKINTPGSIYKGCDSHYSPAGHKVVADDVLPQLKAILGW